MPVPAVPTGRDWPGSTAASRLPAFGWSRRCRETAALERGLLRCDVSSGGAGTGPERQMGFASSPQLRHAPALEFGLGFKGVVPGRAEPGVRVCGTAGRSDPRCGILVGLLAGKGEGACRRAGRVCARGGCTGSGTGPRSGDPWGTRPCPVAFRTGVTEAGADLSAARGGWLAPSQSSLWVCPSPPAPPPLPAGSLPDPACLVTRREAF